MDFNVYVLERLMEDRMAEARRTAARAALATAGRRPRGSIGGTLARLARRVLAARGGATAAKAPAGDRRGWARTA
jgi:hypothetical protein